MRILQRTWSVPITCYGFCNAWIIARRSGLKTRNAGGDLLYVIGDVRQGCISSPVRRVGNAGVDFQDGTRTILDLRFAGKMFGRRSGKMFG